MAIVLLGNPQPSVAGSTVDANGEGILKVVPDPEASVEGVLRDLFHDDGTANSGLWPSHSTAAAPSWVESDNSELAAAIAARTGCRLGRTLPA